jgi:hypothetical protein
MSTHQKQLNDDLLAFVRAQSRGARGASAAA